MGGNTGVSMGGWFRREIKSRDDVRGLKIRSLGLGGEVYRRLGAIPQTTSPGEILVALQSGVIDGAEFVGPGSDLALGFYRFAPFYYGPGFNKPNGTGECIVSLKAWDGARRRAQGDRRARLRRGGLLRARRDGAAQHRGAGDALDPRHVQLRTFPADLIAAARATAAGVLADVAGKSAAARKVHDAYVAFRDRIAPWSRVSLQAVLEAREG